MLFTSITESGRLPYVN